MEEKERSERPVKLYREVAQRSLVIRDVLIMLSEMESSGHTAADVLRIIDA